MPVLIPELEDLTPPLGTSHKPKHVLHGRRMKQAKKCLKSIETLYREDVQESLKAERMNQTPLLVTGTRSSASDKAFQLALERLRALVALKL